MHSRLKDCISHFYRNAMSIWLPRFCCILGRRWWSCRWRKLSRFLSWFLQHSFLTCPADAIKLLNQHFVEKPHFHTVRWFDKTSWHMKTPKSRPPGNCNKIFWRIRFRQRSLSINQSIKFIQLRGIVNHLDVTHFRNIQCWIETTQAIPPSHFIHDRMSLANPRRVGATRWSFGAESFNDFVLTIDRRMPRHDGLIDGLLNQCHNLPRCPDILLRGNHTHGPPPKVCSLVPRKTQDRSNRCHEVPRWMSSEKLLKPIRKQQGCINSGPGEVRFPRCPQRWEERDNCRTETTGRKELPLDTHPVLWRLHHKIITLESEQIWIPDSVPCSQPVVSSEWRLSENERLDLLLRFIWPSSFGTSQCQSQTNLWNQSTMRDNGLDVITSERTPHHQENHPGKCPREDRCIFVNNPALQRNAHGHWEHRRWCGWRSSLVQFSSPRTNKSIPKRVPLAQPTPSDVRR